MKTRFQQGLALGVSVILLVILTWKGWLSPKARIENSPQVSEHSDSHEHGAEENVCLDSLFALANLSLSWTEFSNLEPSMKADQATKWLRSDALNQIPILKPMLQIDAGLSDSTQTDILFEAGKELIDSSLAGSFSASCRQSCIDYAAKAFEKAYAYRPESVEIMNAVATMRVYLQEDVMNGVQMFLKVLEKDPENEAALYNLGMLAIESGQWKKAEERFEKLVFLHPQKEQYAQILEDIRKKGQK